MNVEERVRRALHELAETQTPDVGRARDELDTDRRSDPRRRSSSTGVWWATAAAGLLVIAAVALLAGERGRDLASVPFPDTVTTTPDLPSTDPTDEGGPYPVPDVVTAGEDAVAVVDGAGLEAAVRRNPMEAWVVGSPVERWFVERDADGAVTTMVVVRVVTGARDLSDLPVTQRFGEREVVVLDDGTEPVYMWPDGDDLVGAFSVGEPDPDLVDAVVAPLARGGLAASVDAVEEVEVPVVVSRVEYGADVALTLWRWTGTADPAVFGDWADELTATIGSVPPVPAVETDPTRLVQVDEQQVVAITAAPAAVDRLAAQVRVLPANQRTVSWAGDDLAPNDAHPLYAGSIALGRWALNEWIDDDGALCRTLATEFSGGSSGCGTVSAPTCSDQSRYTVTDPMTGRSTARALTMIHAVVDEVTMRRLGVDLEVTVEHDGEFTFAWADVPEVTEPVEVDYPGRPDDCIEI